MAGKPLRFFGPATIVGDQTFYTPFIDVADYDTLTIRLRVYGAIGTSPTLTVTIEHGANPTSEDAETLGAAFTQATGVTDEDKAFTASTDKLLNYARAKIVVGSAQADAGFFFELSGVAKSGE